MINAFPVRAGDNFEVQEHHGTHNITLARCSDYATAERIIVALKAVQPEARPSIPDGYSLLKNSTFEERSWPEDVSHENGSYYCECCICRRQFQGHKRRVLCKVCTNEEVSPHAPQSPQGTIKDKP